MIPFILLSVLAERGRQETIFVSVLQIKAKIIVKFELIVDI